MEVRYALVSTRYRQRVNFSWDLFQESRLALGRLLEFKRRLREAAARPDRGAPPDLEAPRREFAERMDDDLDVAGALGVVHTFARDGNRAVDQGLGGAGARTALDLLESFDRVFGVLREGGGVKPPEEVLRLAQERQEARRRKDFKAADAAREKIRALGWAVEDTKDGVQYRHL